ncbi:hypothetical protein ACO2Q0_20640 [Phenylobacterium sp. VNQ135]
MQLRLSAPVSRLICLGSAKASTNAIRGYEGELQPNVGFEE